VIVVKALLVLWLLVIPGIAGVGFAVHEFRWYWRTRHLPQGRMVDWASPAMRERARWN
jgi:hypothetical protein